MRTLAVMLLLIAAPVCAEEVYFASTLGTGTGVDAYRSGCAPGASAIDLRDVTGKDLWICRSASMDGATNPIPLSKTMQGQFSGTTKGDIASKIGKSLNVASDNPMLMLKELLIDSGKIKPARDGKLKIYFGEDAPIYQKTAWSPIEDGGLFADAQNLLQAAYRAMLEPAVAYAVTLATETFTNSNGDLGGRTHVHAWTEFTGTQWVIASNQASGPASSGPANEARNDSPMDTDDHTITATLISHTNGSGSFSRCGVIGRKDNSATRTHYTLFANAAAGGWELRKLVGGSATTLATFAQTPQNSDVMKLTIDGSAVTGTVNSTIILGPVTDTSITGNTYGGLYAHSDGSAITCVIDSWIGADIVLSTTRKRGVIQF